ncbi:MAG: GTPase [Xenococcaceae cyanobacterium]
MNQTQSQFNAATIAEQFNNNCNKFYNLLSRNQNENLLKIKDEFHQELQAYQQDGILSVAFVGQYSAGKSTIISALTGRRDIKIDADIATDRTSSYDWNGIKIIDTPGLFTDRQDHDDITYEAINKADLLVFCLTYMLFDSITVENFKKLAYEQGYRWKMMLVINKMSDEAGEEAEKIANYRHSLTEALKPYSLDELPVCFIDAKDYCDGVDEEDDFLCEISRIDTFTQELNNFVDRRGSLAKFDTPVRMALNAINEAQTIFTRNSGEDATYFEILNQLSRRITKERSRIKTKIQTIALKLSSAVAQEGVNLANCVGQVSSKTEWEYKQKEVDLNVQKYYEKAGQEMQAVVNTAIEDIRQEVEEVFKGNLAQAFIAYVEKKLDASVGNIDKGIDIEVLRTQFSKLKTIAEYGGVNITKIASRGFLNTASKTGFLRSIDVAGSGLHQTVLNVGKFVGFKFKPWQAVGVAKNIANFAKFVGPVLAIAALGMDIAEIAQERKREKQMSDLRRDITSQFQSMAKDLENQLEIQFYEFDRQVYGEIENKIADARKQNEEAIATSNTWMKELISIRQEFETILKNISLASTN